MWNAKNAMLKNLIAIKYEQLTSFKKIYHIKGTFNKYDSNFMSGVIDELEREIDALQDLLASYNALDLVDAVNAISTWGMHNEINGGNLK